MKIAGTLKVAAVAFLVSFGGAMSVGAYAADGTHSNYTVNGYNYTNWASAYGGTPSLDGHACTSVKRNGSGTIPAGWMGATARAFQGTTLKIESGYQFTSTAVASTANCVTTRGVFTGLFYSYGVTAAYNGNGNSFFYTFKSPTQTQG